MRYDPDTEREREEEWEPAGVVDDGEPHPFEVRASAPRASVEALARDYYAMERQARVYVGPAVNAAARDAVRRALSAVGYDLEAEGGSMYAIHGSHVRELAAARDALERAREDERARLREVWVAHLRSA